MTRGVGQVYGKFRRGGVVVLTSPHWTAWLAIYTRRNQSLMQSLTYHHEHDKQFSSVKQKSSMDDLLNLQWTIHLSCRGAAGPLRCTGPPPGNSRPSIPLPSLFPLSLPLPPIHPLSPHPIFLFSFFWPSHPRLTELWGSPTRKWNCNSNPPAPDSYVLQPRSPS